MSEGRIFRTVYLDPPWPERGGGKVKRGADRHYKMLRPCGRNITKRHHMLEVLHSCPHWWDIEETCHIYMWSTDNYLPWATWLLTEGVGGTFHRTLPWVKDRQGIGQYFRGRHELLLFATRGQGAIDLRKPGNFTTADLADAPQPTKDGKRVHSKKPARTYDLIEGRSQGTYLEMFARSEREGWTSWGNEIAG